MGMEEKIKLAKGIIREKTFGLKPEDYLITRTTDVDPHYTFVYRLPRDLTKKFSNIAFELKKLDESLILNPPALYHITFFHCKIADDVEKISEVISEYLNKTPFTFNIENLLLTEQGIAINFYAEDISFIEMRERLYEIVGNEFPNTDKGIAAWVTLARFSRAPSKELVEYVRGHFNDKFGELSILRVELYVSSNKILEGAERLRFIL